MSNPRPPLVAIVGPTTSGKTALSLELAAEFNGEIVSADSRQVYRGLDIGTAKVGPVEQTMATHHLIDVADPNETYTVAEYQGAAIAAIQHIQQHGKLPLLVGGSGLYVRAVVDNLRIPEVPPQPALREKLEQRPLDELVARLKEVDPVGYDTIDLKNPRRVIRALEVWDVTGKPFSSLRQAGDPLFDTFQVGIRRTPDELRQSIVESLKKRWAAGLADEVRALHQSGVPWERLESFGLEYRRTAEFLQEQRGEAETLELLERDIVAFAKRQLTWFTKDKRITWIDQPTEAEQLISEWLVGRSAELV